MQILDEEFLLSLYNVFVFHHTVLNCYRHQVLLIILKSDNFKHNNEGFKSINDGADILTSVKLGIYV